METADLFMDMLVGQEDRKQLQRAQKQVKFEPLGGLLRRLVKKRLEAEEEEFEIE